MVVMKMSKGINMNKFHPTHFVVKFCLSGEEISLHRIDAKSLAIGGVGIVYHNGTSIGSIELINADLIINDDQDEELLYVKDILSDIIY